ncbi:phosphatase PAP2 family protein [Pseudohoeflea coraliihabitans]|uniref:Phosphatase PAP2 family protein n=1 Tax=Pseudohoeflea coraliihabitans TaxID=2860393 RepID=A0ABS6WQV9_9HYPH|nr:phosphatase PAP2 family protein [Pseudohoeflea sp. DP4N28-3]MBW3098305.1 phosphatase PAP2 family protein [Pseudohoeflea sp. DP4N28-3]
MISKRLARFGAREWPVIVALLLPAGALWAFVELTDEVAEGSTQSLDETILLALRTPGDPTDPLGPHWLEEMMRDFTGLGGIGVLTIITLSAIGYLLLDRKFRGAVAVGIAVSGGLMISTLIKMGFDRARPDLVPHGSYVATASFPSGHSMMAAIVYLTLAAMVARLRPDWRTRIYLLATAVVIVLLIGVSRVYLGVHWPTDVLAGWTVGSAWAMICWVLMLRLQRQGDVEASG